MGAGDNGAFSHKVVWITGAGTGIGQATARMFAAGGARIALLGRRPEPLEAVRAGCAAEAGEVTVLPLDVADRAAVDGAAKGLLEQFGRVDILVNNAGLNIPERKLRVLEPAAWDQVILVNLTGAYNMVQAVLPGMRAQGGGLIVNISSMAGKRASGLSGAAYTASKHGMNGFSDAVNAEEWPHGIRSSVVCPGEVNTPIMERRPVKLDRQDLERMMQPEDVAAVVRMLAEMPPRTTLPEILMLPTHKREFKPGELG